MSACNAGDPGLIPGLGISPGEVNGNPPQDSCLENSTDWGSRWATVHGVAKSRTRLSDFTSLSLSLWDLHACLVRETKPIWGPLLHSVSWVFGNVCEGSPHVWQGRSWAKGGEHVNLGVPPSKAHRAPTSGVTDTAVLCVLRPVGHLFAPLGDPQSQSRMLSAPREGGNSASNNTWTWDSAFPLFCVITEVIAGNPSWRHVLPSPPQISKGGLPAPKSTSGMQAPPFCGKISSLVMKMAAGTKMAPKWSHSHDKGCNEDKKWHKINLFSWQP